MKKLFVYLCCILLACSVLTATAEPAIKNVLFIISDDLKASVLPAYGNEVCRTSNLDQLVKSRLVFERAYCQGAAADDAR